MTWVAGIDGGGTSTRLQVRDAQNAVLSSAEFGPFNIASIGEQAFCQRLDELCAACPALADCAALLSDTPAFFLINSYTTGLAASVLKNVLRVSLPKGNAVSDEVGLPIERDNLVLPCGSSGRWTPDKQNA